MANTKRQLFLKRRLRVRNKLRKVNSGRVRLSVHRSNKNISAQLIDDVNGLTLGTATSLTNSGDSISGTKIERAFEVGKKIAEVAKSNGINTVSFDRGGYLYHGRIKSLATGAREAGLKF